MTLPKNLSLALSLSLSLTAAACTDGTASDVGTDNLGLGIEGIYHVDSLTHNDAACAPGGDSALGADTYAVVTSSTVLGTPIVTVTSCASPDDCRAKAADLASGQGFEIDFSYSVLASETDGAFTGHGATTGFDDGGGECTAGELTTTTLTVSGASLSVQQQVTVAADYAAENGDTCTTADTQQAAAGKACSQFESMTADFVASL